MYTLIEYRRTRFSTGLMLLVGVLSLLAASCGEPGDEGELTGSTTDAIVVEPSTPPTTTGATVASTEATSDHEVTAVESPPPGRPVETIFAPGAIFGVIGVVADDQLDVRALPGTDQTVVHTLDPLTTGLVFSGRARLFGAPESIWYEVEASDIVGWVDSRFVAPLSGTFDITSEIIEMEGAAPTGSTIEEIGGIVVDRRSRFADPEPSSIVVHGPTTGDPGEIIYDLTGFHDDSVRGERLHLYIGDADEGTDPLELERVDVTYLCWRGGGGGTDLCP